MSSQSNSMRAATVSGPQTFEITHRPIPEPGPEEVRVRVQACGICGSDLHSYHADLLPNGHTPGHEISGVIDATGSGVNDLSAGDRVAIEPLLSCGKCPQCLAGRHSICRSAQLFGIDQPGGLAEQIVVPQFRAHRVADDLDAAVAALTEPVAVAVHALSQAQFEPGERVLILGSGTVGLVSVLAAHSLGAREVWASARHTHQAELARNLGASRILTEQEAQPSGLAELSLAHDIDVAIETVGGRANTLEAACMAVRPGGRVSVLGLFQESPVFPALSLVMKEVTVTGSNCYAHSAHRQPDFRIAADLVDRERERLAALISRRLPLEETNDGFRMAADKSSGVTKISILPTT